MMTSLAAAIGLLPAAIATGIGAQSQQPLARVVVGGMLTSPVLILVVLPVLYLVLYRRNDLKA
jgi:cobalt-zinc-cadmium resistance protein CzcA